MKKIDTFSVHSLKLLEESPEEFKKRYIEGLYFIDSPESAKLGKKFHALISYCLKGYDVLKFENALSDAELAIWNALKADPIMQKEFPFVEYPFLVKEEKFYLTGRFDAVFKDNDGYTILDWKTKTLPKSPENDLQSVVYLYCASKILNTENISMTYCSISTLERVNVKFTSQNEYYERISGIINKLTQ